MKDNLKQILFSKQKAFPSPLKMFVDAAFAARLWFFTALILLVVIAIQPYFIIKAYRNQEQVVILDGAGTYSIAPLLEFKSAKALHENIALLATLSLFSLNPHGFDYPEMLESIFYKEAREKANGYLNTIKEEFLQKNIHQKQQVFEIKILQTRNQVVMAQVNGELIRSGLFENKNFTENLPFKLDLVLVRNPDMMTNKRYPLAVHDYHVVS